MTEECTLELNGSQARLDGVLTFETSAGLHRAMEHLRREGRNVDRVDLSAVTASDSAGLALLLEWQAVSRASGESLVLTGAPDILIQLAKLCEATELLGLSGRGKE